MNRPFVVPAIAAALLLPACAQVLAAAYTPPTHNPAQVKAGTYVVEPNHTQVLFSVSHFGFTNFYGNFSGVTGSLAMTPKKISAMTVNVSVPVTSVSTTSPKLTEELKAADWLDAAHYPTMVFRSTGVVSTGATTADVAGTLTLHGETRPLTLHATFNGAGVNMLDGRETVGFQLSGVLSRSAYGVKKFVPLVSDEVTLTIAAAFEKS